MIEMEEWLFPINNDITNSITLCVLSNNDIFINEISRLFLRQLLKIYNREQLINIINDSRYNIVSGMNFYYLCYILCISYPLKHSKNISTVMNDCSILTLCYILLDGRMDVQGADYSEFSDYHEHNDLMELYTRLDCKEELVKLFQAQYKGMIIQSSSQLDDEEYMNIAMEKGERTTDVISSIFGIHIDGAIGHCMQLIDDILDIEDDKLKGINTIATIYTDRYGCVDGLFMKIRLMISKLNNNLFKIIYSYLLCYTTFHNHKWYSNDIKNRYRNNIILNCTPDQLYESIRNYIYLNLYTL